jgi:hypothetical protein
MARQDLERVEQNPWVQFLEGNNPDYPTVALQAALAQVRLDMAEMAADTSTPDTRLSDDMNHINPAKTETLTQLMLGGLPTGRVGSPLYCHVRYFDPARQRAGLPDDVAALVEKISAEAVTLTLINLNQIEPRTVIVQGGAYAEHEITRATTTEQVAEIANSACSIQLAPGCGTQFQFSLKRFANQPSLTFPWDKGY